MVKDPVVQFGVFYALLFPAVFGFGEYHFAEASRANGGTSLYYTVVYFICSIVSIYEICSMRSRNN